MCGIFGIVGSRQAAAELYIALTHQQHRGQDACGIATSDTSGLKTMLGNGLAAEVFNEEKIGTLGGTYGICHNRYPTAGIGDVKECQPFFLSKLGIAFNGNITNYAHLKKRMEREGREFKTHSDGELLLFTFNDAFMVGNENFFEAAKKCQEKLIGGYSAVGIIEGKGIFAFKDPSGIRPLLVGKRTSKDEISYAFASESIALSIEGFTEIRDLKAGEAIFITKDLAIESRILIAREPRPCAFEFVYFSTVESKLEGIPIYSVRKKLGEALAHKIKEKWPELEIDVVIPVPDTSRPAAMSLASALEKPYEEGLVKNRYIGRTFIMPSQKVRENALRLKLKPIESIIKGRNVMVVDDSIVRGTTSKRIVQLIRDFGAKKVYLVSTFPPIRNPCLYGVDFTNENELIAHGKTIEEIEKEIKADKLIYIDPEDLKKCIGLEKVCMACITGEYPTETEHADEMKQQRQKDYAMIK